MMNDKIIGVTAIVLIIGGLVAADVLISGEINPEVIRIADIAVAGILGNMIGVHLRTRPKEPGGK